MDNQEILRSQAFVEECLQKLPEKRIVDLLVMEQKGKRRELLMKRLLGRKLKMTKMRWHAEIMQGKFKGD